MDVRSKDNRISKLVSKPAEMEVDSESTVVYNKTVNLRSLVSARLEYRGQGTGKLYVWDKAGSVVSVDEADSGILLAKRLGSGSCCGSSIQGGNKVFELA